MRAARIANEAAGIAAIALALSLFAWAQPTKAAAADKPDEALAQGSQLRQVKPGSIDDVNAVGRRKIGARGMGNWYSASTERRMGRMYAAEIEKSAPLVADPMVTAYVKHIGETIVANSDCKQMPFTFDVIDEGGIDAFALPGGFLFVSSGLLLALDDQAELAGVMAHEIAHVCAHHAMREMTRMNYAQLGAIPLVMAGWPGISLAGGAEIAMPEGFLHLSREFEEEADYLGIQYLYRAGYDPEAYLHAFEKIQALEASKPGSLAKLFTGHPQTPERIERTRHEIARILPARGHSTQNTPEYDAVKARLRQMEKERHGGQN